MTTRRIALIFLLVACLSVPATATPPKLINYQGRLTDATGKAMAGVFNLTIQIFADSIGGAPLWTESHSGILVESGLFNVILGSITALADTLFSSPSTYLGITIGSDPELAPRSRLVSVPYALSSADSRWSLNNSVLSTNGFWGLMRGGAGNTLSGDSAHTCTNLGVASTVGFSPTSLVSYSTIAGGYGNSIERAYQFIGGGIGNRLSMPSSCSVIGGGRNNVCVGRSCFIGGGDSNSVNSDAGWSVIGGGKSNSATSASGGEGYNTVGGGRQNSAFGIGATVAGGEYNKAGNYSFFVTVGGGERNEAGVTPFGSGGSGATVCGGSQNKANASYSIVGGGYSNTAYGRYSSVGGGSGNQINVTTISDSAWYATIPGGFNNTANGKCSFAAGKRAKSVHDGAFVWGDTTESDVASSAVNEFTARASGGVRFFSNSTLTSGVTLAAGGNAWLSVSDSTAKRNIRSVDGHAILEQLDRLPIKQWSYKSQNPTIEHIGPMAQDFYSIFKLGETDTTISTIDPSGVALAAIKELITQNRRLMSEIDDLKKAVNQLVAQSQQDGTTKYGLK
jgi:hypothetical protein